MSDLSVSKHAVALEIDDFAVRIARLTRGRANTLALTSWNSVQLPAGAMVDGTIIKADVVATTVNQAIATMKGKRLTPRYVALVVPESHVFTTLLPIAGSDPLTQEHVASDASQHLPLPLEEVQLDYQEVESTPQGRQVLVGAAPTEVLTSLSKLLATCHLIPMILEPESAAVVRAVTPPGEPSRTQIVLDLGHSLTTILVARHDLVQFSSSGKDFSGSNLTATIANRLHLTTAQAEKAKRLFGLLPKEGKGEVRKALLPLTNELLKRLRDVESFSMTHLPVPTKGVAAVKLSGGGAALPGLPELLSAELRLPVTPTLPSEVHHWDARAAELDDETQRSMTAVLGTALRLVL